MRDGGTVFYIPIGEAWFGTREGWGSLSGGDLGGEPARDGWRV